MDKDVIKVIKYIETTNTTTYQSTHSFLSIAILASRMSHDGRLLRCVCGFCMFQFGSIMISLIRDSTEFIA